MLLISLSEQHFFAASLFLLNIAFFPQPAGDLTAEHHLSAGVGPPCGRGLQTSTNDRQKAAKPR